LLRPDNSWCTLPPSPGPCKSNCAAGAVHDVHIPQERAHGQSGSAVPRRLCRIYGPPAVCKGYLYVTATKGSTACIYSACPWSADGTPGPDGSCVHAPDPIFDLVMVLATPRVCTSWSNRLRHHCLITSAIAYGELCLRTPQATSVPLCGSRGLTVPFALGQEPPGYPSRLIGLGYPGTIRPAALAHALQPSAAGILLLVDLPYDGASAMDEELRKRNKKVAIKHGFEGARELILAWQGLRVCAPASPLGGQRHCSSPRVLHL